MPMLDIRVFQREGGDIVSNYVSHTVFRGRLPGASTIWFNKEATSPALARLELLAQEFFRLIIPTQPVTRLAFHPVLKTHHILSEEVPGFRDLPFDQQKEFNRGTYYGLGQVSLLAAFLEERDFKNFNAGINGVNRVVKIDGECCFTRLSEPMRAGKITPELLARLPYPFGLNPYNWLDVRMEDRDYSQSDIVKESLVYASYFRNEVNQAILKILLLPEKYIRSFVDAYIPNSMEANQFIDFLLKRQEELKAAAQHDRSFQVYLSTSAARADVCNHLIHLKGFKAGESQFIVDPSCHAVLEREYNERVAEFIPQPFALSHQPTYQTPSISYRGSFPNKTYYQDVNTGIFYIEHENNYYFTNEQLQTITPAPEYSAMMLKAVEDYKGQNVGWEIIDEISNINHAFSGLLLTQDVEQRLLDDCALIDRYSLEIENLQEKPAFLLTIELKKDALRRAAMQQVDKISAHAGYVLNVTAQHIKHVEVDFTRCNNEEDVRNQQHLLLAEIYGLAQNEEVSRAHQVFDLTDTLPAISQAYSEKTQQIEQQARAQIAKIEMAKVEVMNSRVVIEQCVKNIKELTVDFTQCASEEEVGYLRQRLMAEAEGLLRDAAVNKAHKLLGLQNMHPFIADAKSEKQQQIDGEAEYQVVKIRDRRAAAQGIAEVAAEINNFAVDFTQCTNEAEINAYQALVLHQLSEIAESEAIKLAHRALNLGSSHRSILQALMNKQEEMAQTRNLLQQRLDLLGTMNFDAHLHVFAQKIIQMRQKTEHNALYGTAVETMETFHTTIKSARVDFLHNPNATGRAKAVLKEACQGAIDAARPILQEHREWKGAILKFIIEVISFLTCGLTDNKLGLFALTDSNKRLTDFEQTAEHILAR